VRSPLSDLTETQRAQLERGWHEVA
jgi:hypothetical protein